MEVLGIHHVNVNIHSLPEALEFYVDGLGFTSFDRPGFTIDGAWLSMAHTSYIFSFDLTQSSIAINILHSQ